MPGQISPTRRDLLAGIAAAGIAAALPATGARADRPGPAGERLPLVGLGTWITFNVGDDPIGQNVCTAVMRAFFEGGGRVIDSSPMYGSSQAVIGRGLQALGRPEALYAATKVWTTPGSAGPAQIEESRRLWGVERFDLLQVHNLLAWEAHLETLLAMKAEGRLRHVGITTSHGRRHGDVEKIMQSRPIDFVQLTYNVVDRAAERRILPLAAERGIGIVVNRPYRGGSLTEAMRREKLPPWAAEIDCTSWAQIMLKFVVSHPAVTCAIPATTQVAHVRENVAAGAGRMPDQAMRERIAAAVKALT